MITSGDNTCQAKTQPSDYSFEAATLISWPLLSCDQSYQVTTCITRQHMSGDGDKTYRVTAPIREITHIRRQSVSNDNIYRETTHIKRPLRSSDNEYQTKTQPSNHPYQVATHINWPLISCDQSLQRKTPIKWQHISSNHSYQATSHCRRQLNLGDHSCQMAIDIMRQLVSGDNKSQATAHINWRHISGGNSF